MPYTTDSTLGSLTSQGLPPAASQTIARLVCEVIGNDDFVNINSQNAFIQDLVAAVGPATAFDAVCRQLVRITNTVAYPYVGTAYSPQQQSDFQIYQSTYVMRDANVGSATDSLTTIFQSVQFQTLAAFVSAQLPLSSILAVCDYHILMNYLSGINGSSSINTLSYPNSLTPSPYTMSGSALLYAKHSYSISTLANNGNVIFDKTVPAEQIIGGLMKDPVWTYIRNNSNNSITYGLLGALHTVVSADHPVRSFAYLLTPVQFSLSSNTFTRNIFSTTNNTAAFTGTNIKDYQRLKNTETQYIFYFKVLYSTIPNAPSEGTSFDPTQYQLISSSSLQSMSAQSIFTSLAFNGTQSTELPVFQYYGKSVADVRNIPVSNKVIPEYQVPSNFATAGYSSSQISQGFSNSLMDFAILIGLKKMDISNLGVVSYSAGTGLTFKYVDSVVFTPQTIVSNLKAIILDALNTQVQYGGSTLLTNMQNAYTGFKSGATISAANAEAAVLRYLHISAIIGSTIAYSASVSGDYSFSPASGYSNLYRFTQIPYVLAASPSTLSLTAFLKQEEFATYTEADAFVESTIASSTLLTLVPSAPSSQKSKQYFVKGSTTSTYSPVKQYYTLGKITATSSYYNNTTTVALYMDNGLTFTTALPYLADGLTNAAESLSWPATSSVTNLFSLTGIVAYIMKKMNPSNASITDSSLKTNYPTSLKINSSNSVPTPTWSFTSLMNGINNPIVSSTAPYTSPNAKNVDGVSYKALLRAGATDQYIKVDLAVNMKKLLDGIITSTNHSGIAGQIVSGFALPLQTAIYVANNAESTAYGFQMSDIVAATIYSRATRQSVFPSILAAAQNLESNTFISLKWSPAQLQQYVSAGNYLNLNIIDLLTASENIGEEYGSDFTAIKSSNVDRLIYNNVADRQALVSLFCPSLSAERVARIAGLTYAPDIADTLDSYALSITNEILN